MPSSSDPDAALMARVKSGDASAFEQIVQKYHQPVINTTYRLLGDRWEAEDLAQQVFVQVFRFAHRYHPTAKFSTWLFTIVRHLALNEIRRRRRHPAESLDEPITTDDERLTRQIADSSTVAPDAAVLQHELDERIQAAILALPPTQRMAIVLLRYEEMSYEEICQVLRCSMASLKSALHRARLTLRETLADYLQNRR